jgi:type IV secretory pathway component VirB8
MSKKIPASTFLILSAVAASFVGVLVYFAIRKVDVAFISAGVTFIIALVGIATLALMVPEQNNDPDKPFLR